MFQETNARVRWPHGVRASLADEYEPPGVGPPERTAITRGPEEGWGRNA